MGDSKLKKKLKIFFKYMSNILSWTLFVVLSFCCAFLIYYFVSMKIYEKKGPGHEPLISVYTIISGSMEPEIRVYDMIVDMKVENPADLKVGDVISYNSTKLKPGEKISVTHKIIAIQIEDGKYVFTTKGINNPTKDSYPVYFEDISGKVIFKIPQLGRIQFLLASKFGYLICILIPAVIIILKNTVKLIRLLKLEERFPNNILFMPIKPSQKLLTLKGYEKPFERVEIPKESEDEPVKVKQEKSLEEIYDELKQLSNKNKL